MDSIERDEDPDDFYAWLKADFEAMYIETMFIEMAYWGHEMMFGVPCGPTLNMVYPPKLKGIIC